MHLSVEVYHKDCKSFPLYEYLLKDVDNGIDALEQLICEERLIENLNNLIFYVEEVKIN